MSDQNIRKLFGEVCQNELSIYFFFVRGLIEEFHSICVFNDLFKTLPLYFTCICKWSPDLPLQAPVSVITPVCKYSYMQISVVSRLHPSLSYCPEGECLWKERCVTEQAWQHCNTASNWIPLPSFALLTFSKSVFNCLKEQTVFTHNYVYSRHY